MCCVVLFFVLLCFVVVMVVVSFAAACCCCCMQFVVCFLAVFLFVRCWCEKSERAAGVIVVRGGVLYNITLLTLIAAL